MQSPDLHLAGYIAEASWVILVIAAFVRKAVGFIARKTFPVWSTFIVVAIRGSCYNGRGRVATFHAWRSVESGQVHFNVLRIRGRLSRSTRLAAAHSCGL